MSDLKFVWCKISVTNFEDLNFLPLQKLCIGTYIKFGICVMQYWWCVCLLKLDAINANTVWNVFLFSLKVNYQCYVRESIFEMIMIVVAFIPSLWRIIILWSRIFQKKLNWHSNDHCWCNTFAQDEEIGNMLGDDVRRRECAGDLCPFNGW